VFWVEAAKLLDPESAVAQVKPAAGAPDLVVKLETPK